MWAGGKPPVGPDKLSEMLKHPRTDLNELKLLRPGTPASKKDAGVSKDPVNTGSRFILNGAPKKAPTIPQRINRSILANGVRGQSGRIWTETSAKVRFGQGHVALGLVRTNIGSVRRIKQELLYSVIPEKYSPIAAGARLMVRF